MLHYNCGGKLKVVDSLQRMIADNKVEIKRIRKCIKCCKTLITSEVITGAQVKEGYAHGNMPKKREDGE